MPFLVDFYGFQIDGESMIAEYTGEEKLQSGNNMQENTNMIINLDLFISITCFFLMQYTMQKSFAGLGIAFIDISLGDRIYTMSIA